MEMEDTNIISFLIFFYQEGLEAQARLSNEETYKTYRHLTCGTGATIKRILMMKSLRRWKNSLINLDS